MAYRHSLRRLAFLVLEIVDICVLLDRDNQVRWRTNERTMVGG